MILIITHKDDYTADFLINKLNSKGILYKRFNCEDILEFDIIIDFQSSSLVNILGENEFQSVWFRRFRLPRFTDVLQYEEVYLQNEAESFMKGLFAVIQTKWLSNPFAVYKAEYKLFQLQIAKQLGFVTPNTIVTTVKPKIVEFFIQCNKQVIIKPIGQTRISGEENDTRFIYTNKVTEDDIANLDDFDLTPCIFQERIQKEIELRVTVVHDKVFTAAIDSQNNFDNSIDWRREKNKFFAYQIPEWLETRCINLVKELGLNFGAIDIIKNKDGEYVFLEINPNGQWAWIEIETGLMISEAIINFLINDENS